MLEIHIFKLAVSNRVLTILTTLNRLLPLDNC